MERKDSSVISDKMGHWGALLNRASMRTSAISGTGDVEFEWENVVIKFCSDRSLQIVSNGDDLGIFDLGGTELLDDRTKKLSKSGNILLNFASHASFTRRGAIQATTADKTFVSKLRSALRAFVGVSSDPFYPFSSGSGWRPRFRVEDQR